MESQLNSHEAIFAFSAWLTVRDESITLSSKHNAGDICELIKQFADKNNLPAVRENYTDFIIPMHDSNDSTQQ